MAFMIGIISDTHGLLRPEAIRQLAGVRHILHAGDIGTPEVIAALRQIAPVSAIRGNVDKAPWAKQFPETAVIRIEGRSIYLIHDLEDMKIDPVRKGIDAVIYGHSHKPAIRTSGDVLYLNPGSAGRRRFKLPVTLATLDMSSRPLNPIIHDLMLG